MKALQSCEENKIVRTTLSEVVLRPLESGEVLIRSEYSSLNYKDALAVTGKGRIFKQFPLVGGIDVSGTVEDSRDERFKKGDFVLVTGCGLGETHNGGYSTHVIERAENVIRRPKNLSAREAMIYGTAGFTAALCVERMTQNGQKPEMGPLLVTGATGGVGQFTILFFTKLGYEVQALTGKRELGTRLSDLGAAKVIFTSQLELGDRPLETVRYGGAIDNVGGNTLSKLLGHIQLWGNIACVGLVSGHELQASVMPMILRGVSLLGISSNNTPLPLRHRIWERLSQDLKPENLEDFVSEEITLSDVVPTAERMLGRQTHGRVLVKLPAS